MKRGNKLPTFEEPVYRRIRKSNFILKQIEVALRHVTSLFDTAVCFWSCSYKQNINAVIASASTDTCSSSITCHFMAPSLTAQLKCA